MIFIGTHQFTSKADALRKINLMVQESPVGSVGSIMDYDLCMDLLSAHPNGKEKIGTGVAGFYVAFDSISRRNKHLAARRTDGTDIDFSVRKCIYGTSNRLEAFAGLRRAVADQIIAYKIEQCHSGHYICGVTGEALTLANAHVDHVWPSTFLALVTAWMELEGIGFNDIKVVDAPVVGGGVVMADSGLALRWSVFHEEYAQLLIVSDKVNLSIARKVSAH
jgi:hypothetical protein